MYINQGGHKLFQPVVGRGAMGFQKGPFFERYVGITCGKNEAILKPFLLSYIPFSKFKKIRFQIFPGKRKAFGDNFVDF